MVFVYFLFISFFEICVLVITKWQPNNFDSEAFLQLVAFLSLLISTTGIIPVLIQIDTGLVHVV